MAKLSKAALSEIREALELADLYFEKCELAQAQVAYAHAYQVAKRVKDWPAALEALTGLIRLAEEALHKAAVQHWERELDKILSSPAVRSAVPPMAWYCKGAVARSHQDYKLAQRSFHRYLRAMRKEAKPAASGSILTSEDGIARGWAMLAITLMQRGFIRRAEFMARKLLEKYEGKSLHRINGSLYFLLGKAAERESDWDKAMRLYHKAHASFLAEHNWYYHLHCLLGYARLARIHRQYTQAYWYLDLVDKAASGKEFGAIRKELLAERNRLEKDAVDLLIDSHRGYVKTREGGQISLRKQFVLLNILEALSSAHSGERGLSKAEIIEKVWHEPYRPEAHDNKLYYNINRLRKLIEPDAKQPQYVLNWKEGYRLAPGLKVHVV